MLQFLGTFDYRELRKLISAGKYGFNNAVDLGLRRFLFLQVTNEGIYSVLGALYDYFYAGVTAVSNISCQPMHDGGAVDEGAEADTLYDACDIYFSPQTLHF